MRILISTFLLFLFGLPAVSADSKNIKKSCKGPLQSMGFHLVPSGRDQDVLPEYHKAFMALFGPEGFFEEMGMNCGPQMAAFVPGTTMNCLAALHRHVMPHWYDGSLVADALSKPNPVYEFVAPSGEVTRSYYQDMTPLPIQISIFIHVAGHAYVSRVSRFSQQHGIDVMAESLALSHFMTQLYHAFKNPQVEDFYQRLLSLSVAQDLTRGTFTPPEEFKPGAQIQRTLKGSEKEAMEYEATKRHPRSPTPNLLQFFVANLPATTPPELVELARRFERLHRYMSGAASTMIVHEGFCTLLQEMAAEHLPQYATPRFALPYARFMRGVAAPSIKNRYWIGREAYRALRRKFNKREEVQGLAPSQRDAAFIKHLTENYISRMDNWDFLRAALDASWVAKHGLYLARPADGEDMYTGLPPQPPGDDFYPWIVISNDPKRIIDQVTRQAADYRYEHPQPQMVDFNGDGTGIAHLEFLDAVGSKLPLKRRPMVQTLLVYAQLMERPMSLSTVASSTWYDENQGGGIIFPRWGFWPPPWHPKPIRIYPIRVVVYPSGEVKVFEIKTEPSGKSLEEPHAILTEKFQEMARQYQADLDLSLPSTLPTSKVETYTKVAGDMATTFGNLSPMSLYHHAPTSADALSAFNRKLNERLTEILRQVIEGKRKIVRGPNGIRLKALPSIPHFEFDAYVQQLLLGQGEGIPVDPRSMSQMALAKAPYEQDDALQPGGGGRRPGDKYWGPDPNEAYGNGRDEEADGKGEDEGPGRDPGDAALDPSYVEIPLDLYARLLDESIELPRLKPKSARLRARSTRAGSELQRRDGNPVWPTIMRRAFQRGIAMEKTEDPENREWQPADILRDGLSLLPADEWSVRSRIPIKKPDYNAQVTFVVDFSGSMYEVLKVAKLMAFDLKALLQYRYPQIEFRYIAFDSEARVYKDPNEFFSLELLGGTDYAAGFQKALEVQKDFPPNKWDRYVITVGDLEDMLSPELQKAADDIYESSEFSGVIRVNSWADEDGLNELTQYFQGKALEQPWFGYVDVLNGSAYAPRIFRSLFKNDEAQP